MVDFVLKIPSELSSDNQMAMGIQSKSIRGLLAKPLTNRGLRDAEPLNLVNLGLRRIFLNSSKSQIH